jgi:hypothetical protein
MLLTEAFLAVLHSQIQVRRFTISVSLVLVVLAFYNFNIQYCNPLKQEYNALYNYINNTYTPGMQQVYFIRPDKNLFQAQGLRTYKDELGVPSTYRDWVPETIVKQLVYEKTGKRAQAAALQVQQFETKAAFDSLHITIMAASMVVDMNSIYNSAMAQRR